MAQAAEPALKVHTAREFPADALPKDIARQISDAFRHRPASELDGMTLDDFLIANPNAATYGGVGSIPERFLRFREDRLEYTREKGLYDGMTMATFMRVTNIRFVPFAMFVCDGSSAVHSWIERWTIAFLWKVSQELCINILSCDSKRSLTYRINYVVIIPDRVKLREDHGIVVKAFTCKKDDVEAGGVFVGASDSKATVGGASNDAKVHAGGGPVGHVDPLPL